MGELQLGLRHRDGRAALAQAFLGPLAGRWIPARMGGGVPSGLLESESLDPELHATRFVGLPLSAALDAALRGGGPVEAWLAVLAGLPRGGRLAIDAYLRLGARTLQPIAVLKVEGSAMRLVLPVDGAPLVDPPARDEGGPIDQRWREAAERNRAELLSPIAGLLSVGWSIQVEGPGLSPANLAPVRAALGV